MTTTMGLLVSMCELLFDYPSFSWSEHHWAYLEVTFIQDNIYFLMCRLRIGIHPFQGFSRICLFTINVQFCYLCIRIAKMYNNLHTTLQLTTISNTGKCILYILTII